MEALLFNLCMEGIQEGLLRRRQELPVTPLAHMETTLMNISIYLSAQFSVSTLSNN